MTTLKVSTFDEAKEQLIRGFLKCGESTRAKIPEFVAQMEPKIDPGSRNQ
jgi:hypothetical protein